MTRDRSRLFTWATACACTFVQAALVAGESIAQCNSRPIALDDQVEFFGRAISVEAMANDREIDGEALDLSITSFGACTSSSSSSSALAVSVDNGTVRLTPVHEGHASSCTLTYTIEDEHGFTATARIFIHSPGFFFADGFETGSTLHWQTVTSGGGVEP